MKEAKIYEISEKQYTHLLVFRRRGFKSYSRRFKSESEAVTERDAFNERLIAEGASAVHIDARSRKHIETALKILDGTGLSIVQAAVIARKDWNGQRGGRKLVKLAEEFIEAKERQGRADSTVLNLKSRVKQFLKHSGLDRAGEINRNSIEDFIYSFKNSTTQRNALAAVHNFCAWLARRGVLESNPAANIERPTIEQAHEVAHLSPINAWRFLRRLERAHPDCVAYFAVLLFGFLRPGEAEELSQEDLRTKTIRVTKGKMRTRKRRLVPITPTLRVWLKEYDFKVPGRRKQRSCRALCPQPWKEDLCRHTGITYRLAETDDEKQTAREAGNSPETIYAHYYELNSDQEAAFFHSIKPGHIKALA